MATKSKKTPLGTTPTTVPPTLSSVDSGIGALNGAGALGSVGGAAGIGAGSSVNPGVPTSQAGDPVVFSDSTNVGKLGLPGSVNNLFTTDSSGNQQTTYNNAVTLLHQVQDNRKVVTEIQNDLQSAGYIPANTKISYGTLDASTTRGWKQLITDAIGTKIPVTTLLTHGAEAPNLVKYVYALQGNITSAEKNATQITNSNVSLNDPNQTAQAFASAMEAIGMGAPSQEQVNAFVQNFHSAEVSASVDQATAQKQNYLSSQGNLQGALAQATSGNLSQAQALMNTPGPVDVATKTTPNLDAEAMAAAKNADPSQYYATGVSYYGNIIHDMLSGNVSGQSAPTAPSQTAPGGAILTSPLGGM